jgi:predicted secreted protein
MRFVILATVAVASFAVPAAAKEKKPVDPNKKICRSEQVTGSIFGRSVCHTATDWQSIDDANRRDVRNFHDKKTQGSVNL